MPTKLILGLAGIVLIAGSASAQIKGGKVPWNHDPQAAMQAAKKKGLPMMLYFTSKGCSPCAALERGAFSDDSVVEASKKIMPVLVDCDWGNKNQDVSGKYKVRGYPTVVFTDSEGMEVERLRRRDASSVSGQINSIAGKYAKSVVWADYDDVTFRNAAGAKKPVLVFFSDGKANSVAQEEVFIDERLEALLDQFVLVKHEITKGCDVCKANRMRKGPAIYFMDPLEDEPEKKPFYKTTSMKSAKILAEMLKTSYKRWEKALVALEHQVNTINVTISERDGYRYIVANGLPDHRTGAFPNRGNPNRISRQKYVFRMPLASESADGPLSRGRVLAGVALNGVPFDPGTAEVWTANRSRAHGGPGRHYAWRYEALTGGLNLGLDSHHAHVQPNGAYHYHALPNGLYERLAGRPVMQRPDVMVLLGYAADGFAIYGLWAHEDPIDSSSVLKKLKSSYRVKEGKRPLGSDSPGGDYDGRFTADWEYAAGIGDLDEHNGRFGVTPEYPAGSYYYVITDTFPFLHRSFQGTPDASFMLRGGPRGRPRGRQNGEQRPPPQ